MVRKKSLILSGIIAVSVLALCFAADTRDIDAVRKKDVLSSSDKDIIANFLDSAVQDIVYTEDTSKIGSLRSAIVSRKTSLSAGAKEQYKNSFNQASVIAMENGFAELEQLEDPNKADNIELNMLILMSELANRDLISLAETYFDSQRDDQRYAAINSVSNKAIISELNSANTKNAVLSKQISQKLTAVLKNETAPSVVLLIAEFAGNVHGFDTAELLIAVAEKRIAEYQSWTVKDEIIDADILDMLGKKADKTADPQLKSGLIRNFAQLYSCAFQRYQKGGDVLDDGQKSHLITVLVATEQGILNKLLASPTTATKKAAEKKDIDSLMSIHDNLLGSDGQKGSLAEIIPYDYGTEGENKIYAPKQLSDPNSI